MDKTDYLSRYAKGWVAGDASTIVEAVDDSYHFDDPNSGSISKEGFLAYFAALKEQVGATQGGPRETFMDISEVITHEEGGVLTAWCWWSFPGTPIQGGGLIKVGDSGVLSERIAYYTKLPG